jgi:hypothetical protein
LSRRSTNSSLDCNLAMAAWAAARWGSRSSVRSPRGSAWVAARHRTSHVVVKRRSTSRPLDRCPLRVLRLARTGTMSAIRTAGSDASSDMSAAASAASSLAARSGILATVCSRALLHLCCSVSLAVSTSDVCGSLSTVSFGESTCIGWSAVAVAAAAMRNAASMRSWSAKSGNKLRIC